MRKIEHQKVDDKPMVIHTKEKTKLHVKTAPETKIKAGNVLTVERTPKFAGAEREAKADNIPKHMEDTDRSFLKELLPWSDKLPKHIRK